MPLSESFEKKERKDVYKRQGSLHFISEVRKYLKENPKIR